MQGPVGQYGLDLSLEPQAAILGLLDGAVIFLEGDLLGRVIEALIAKPATVPLAPVFDAILVDPAVTQQE